MNPRKRDPNNIMRADKTKRRKGHLKELARLKTPKEGSIKGRKREREKKKEEKKNVVPMNEVASHKR